MSFMGSARFIVGDVAGSPQEKIVRLSDGLEMRIVQGYLDALMVLANTGTWPSEDSEEAPRGFHSLSPVGYPNAIVGGGDGAIEFWSLKSLLNHCRDLIAAQEAQDGGWAEKNAIAGIRGELAVFDEALASRHATQPLVPEQESA